MKKFVMSGVVKKMPLELENLTDKAMPLDGFPPDSPHSEIVELVTHFGAGQLMPAGIAKNFYKNTIARHNEDKFSPDEIANILATQQGLEQSFFMDKIQNAFREGLLRFWLPDGSPHDHKDWGDEHSMAHEWYLGLDNEYTTSDAVNGWLKNWGAKYVFMESGRDPAEKQKPPMEMRADAIEDWLKQNGHEVPPPPQEPGRKDTLKGKARDYMTNNPSGTPFYSLRFTRPTFDQAWQVMLKRYKKSDI